MLSSCGSQLVIDTIILLPFLKPTMQCAQHMSIVNCAIAQICTKGAHHPFEPHCFCEGPTIRKNFHLSRNGKQILISAYILRFTNPSQQYHKTNQICWDITGFIFYLPFISRSTKWHYTNNRRKWGARNQDFKVKRSNLQTHLAHKHTSLPATYKHNAPTS